jgi:serine/threonine protein kinase
MNIQIEISQELDNMDSILNKELGNYTHQLLPRGGGSGGGSIYMDLQKLKILKVIFSIESFQYEKNVAEFILSREQDIPLPIIGKIYPEFQAILFENKFKEGQTLNTFLEKKKLTEHQKKILCTNLILAMKNLHNNNIFHGDLKLSNIIIDPSSLEIQFIDLGSMGFSNQKSFDLTRTTKSNLPPQINQSIIQLLSCAFDEKIKLDEYAMFLILQKISPDFYLLDHLEKNGHLVAKQIMDRF